RKAGCETAGAVRPVRTSRDARREAISHHALRDLPGNVRQYHRDHRLPGRTAWTSSQARASLGPARHATVERGARGPPADTRIRGQLGSRPCGPASGNARVPSNAAGAVMTTFMHATPRLSPVPR